MAGGPKTPTNFVQDGPPAGGFAPINVKRNLPAGGMSSAALMGGCVFTFCYGLYVLVNANRERREFSREEQDIRMSIMPFLQVETDVKLAYVREKTHENEAEIMKDVPNWEVGASVYKTRWMPGMTIFGLNPNGEPGRA